MLWSSFLEQVLCAPAHAEKHTHNYKRTHLLPRYQARGNGERHTNRLGNQGADGEQVANMDAVQVSSDVGDTTACICVCVCVAACSCACTCVCVFVCGTFESVFACTYTSSCASVCR